MIVGTAVAATSISTVCLELRDLFHGWGSSGFEAMEKVSWRQFVFEDVIQHRISEEIKPMANNVFIHKKSSFVNFENSHVERLYKHNAMTERPEGRFFNAPYALASSKESAAAPNIELCPEDEEYQRSSKEVVCKRG